jgi:hypothetical protein
MSNAETFETTDIGLVAFLRCKGFDLLNLKKRGDKTAFVLNEQSDRRKLVMDYFNGAEVSCRDFMNRIQEAKTLIHQVGH